MYGDVHDLMFILLLPTDHVRLWNINYGVLMILDKEQITKNIWSESKNVYSVNTVYWSGL